MEKERKRAVMVTSSPLRQHPRAFREAETLIHKGYSVTSLCWDRSLKIPMVEQWEDGSYPREVWLGLKASLDYKVIPFWPIWWCFVFFRLMVTRWDIACAFNIDSIIPTVIAGKLKRKPVIYDIPDVYEDSRLFPRVVRDILLSIDKVFMRLASGIVLADELQIDEVGGIPNSKVVPVYDSPPGNFGNRNINYQRNEVFALFFGGILASEKTLNLDKIFTAIEDIEGVKITIAGYGDLVEEIKRWSLQMPDKIQFIGQISRAEVLQRSAEADLLFVLRSPTPLVNKYTCGSKLLEAMMCGRPILVNRGTSTAIKVSQEKCGLVVDASNIEEIKGAIIKLRDNLELCRELGANARKAYEQKYSWSIMEQRLINLYDELTQRVKEEV